MPNHNYMKHFQLKKSLDPTRQSTIRNCKRKDRHGARVVKNRTKKQDSPGTVSICKRSDSPSAGVAKVGTVLKEELQKVDRP